MKNLNVLPSYAGLGPFHFAHGRLASPYICLDLFHLPVASRVASRCGKFAARIFSCATRRL